MYNLKKLLQHIIILALITLCKIRLNEQAAQNLKKAKSEYDKYKKVLAKAKADYASGKLTKTEIETIKDYDNLYKTAIALATATLAGKTAAMADEIEAAGESTIAGGFNIDIRADLDLLISESQRLQTIAKPSSLTAGQNIKITTGENAQITGAQITAGKKLEITAQNTNINPAQDTTSENFEQKQSHISYGWGLFGGPDTGGIDASINKNTINKTTYKNAHLTGQEITINTAENTEIAGANLNAGTITINTGNDLTVQSLQDKYFEYGFSLGGGLSFEQGKEYGATANYGQTNGNGKWVNRQTSLYGADALTITTQNNTNFIGATANTPTGNLQINTGTLSYSDLSDRNYKQEIGLQASLTKETDNYGNSQTDKEFEANLGISDQLQSTQTAIGAGQITIRDNSEQDLSDLNRNPTTAQTATDKINIDISIETDTLKAFDPDSYDALKELPKNIAQIGKNITREAADIIDSIKETKDGAITDYIRKTAAREAILKINANPEIKEILENQTKYTTAEIKAVTQYIATIIAKVRFAQPPQIEYYNGNQLTEAQRLTVNSFGETINKSQAAGFFDPATSTIFINAALNTSATQIINTIANETSHYIDYKNKITFDGLTGTREQISDIASNEITKAWQDQFGTITYIPDINEYQIWLNKQTQIGAYILGNYNAGLVDEPQPLYDKPRSMIEVYRLFHAAKGDPYEAEWKYRHYYTRNILNNGLPETEEKLSKEYEIKKNYESVFHQLGDGENNKKYLLIDSLGGSKEAVYDEQGNLVTDPANKGTYNFENDKIGHFFYDMLPYFKYGNSEDDPTTLWEKIKVSGKSIKLFWEYIFKEKKDEE